MIVDPDFLDHWRTRMVVNALQDEFAPFYIMRLWAHCQARRSDTFEIPPEGLKAQCRFQGDATLLESVLSDAQFIKRNGAFIQVLGWAEKNAYLVNSWENGSKGGRPKKAPREPAENPPETHGLPVGNPQRTQTEPIREEKRREEIQTPPPPLRGEPSGSKQTPGFARFWAAWPAHHRKVARLQCWAKWKAKELDGIAERIVAHVEAMKRTDMWRKDGGEFVPAPLVYLNQARWEGPLTSHDPPENRAAQASAQLLAQMARDAEAARSPESIAARDAMLEKVRLRMTQQ